jgi:hypothetical protein
MKAYRGSRNRAPLILEFGTRWKQLSVSCPTCPGQLPLKERTPGTHWLGCWVDHTVGLDVLEKKQSLSRNHVTILWLPTCSLVTILTEQSCLLFIKLFNLSFCLGCTHLQKCPHATGHIIAGSQSTIFKSCSCSVVKVSVLMTSHTWNNQVLQHRCLILPLRFLPSLYHI